MWEKKELTQIISADELHLSSMRADGTLRNPVTIWMVEAGGNLYIRAVKGKSGLWYRHVLESLQGHIDAGGVAKDVSFEVLDDEEINMHIDKAYQAKYSKYGASIVGSTLTPEAKAATLKVIPRYVGK